MRVLMVVNTVFELYYLSSVAYLLQLTRPDVRLSLLIAPWVFTKLNQELRSLYSDIQVIRFPSITGLPVWDIINSVRFRYQLSRLDLDADIICISSFREYFANILCRYYASGPRLVALRMSNYESNQLCRVKRPLRSIYLNLVNRMFGVSTMEYRWHSDTAFTYAYWYTRNPYHRTICISDWGHGQTGSEFRLPPPFISLKQLYGPTQNRALQQRPAILVAGERTPLFERWDDTAQALYEQVFDFLRQNFAEYELFFKPRADFTDVDKLRLHGFHLIPADVPFEELCLRNTYSRVISVKSTASKVAAYCGQPAYVVYPMFNLPSNLTKTLDAYFADMRSVIKVFALDQLLSQPTPLFNFDLKMLGDMYWKAIVN